MNGRPKEGKQEEWDIKLMRATVAEVYKQR